MSAIRQQELSPGDGPRDRRLSVLTSLADRLPPGRTDGAQALAALV